MPWKNWCSNYWGSRRKVTVAIAPAYGIGKQRTNHHWCHPEVELIIGKQPPVPEVGNPSTESLQFNLSKVCGGFVKGSSWSSSWIAVERLSHLKLIERCCWMSKPNIYFWLEPIRDNEVHPTHPLVLTLESLRKQGAVSEDNPDTLTLEPLSQLIAETLDYYWHRSFPAQGWVKRRAIPSLSVNFENAV